MVGRHEDRVVSVSRRPRRRVPPVHVFHELLVDGRYGRTDLVGVGDFHVQTFYKINCIGSFQILTVCFFLGITSNNTGPYHHLRNVIRAKMQCVA